MPDAEETTETSAAAVPAEDLSGPAVEPAEPRPAVAASPVELPHLSSRDRDPAVAQLGLPHVAAQQGQVGVLHPRGGIVPEVELLDRRGQERLDRLAGGEAGG